MDIKKVIRLDDKNEYVIVSKATYKGDIYYYLIDINDNSNVKFCRENKGEESTLYEINDGEVIRELIPLFFEESKHLIHEMLTENQ